MVEYIRLRRCRRNPLSRVEMVKGLEQLNHSSGQSQKPFQVLKAEYSHRLLYYYNYRPLQRSFPRLAKRVPGERPLLPILPGSGISRDDSLSPLNLSAVRFSLTNVDGRPRSSSPLVYLPGFSDYSSGFDVDVATANKILTGPGDGTIAIRRIVRCHPTRLQLEQ